MAYLAVAAHQPYGDLVRMSKWELDAFYHHVAMIIEMETERLESERRKVRDG